MFYVKKCSGQYQDNKAAARYIHQMAEEIILQLAGVAGEIRKNRGEPELFTALLEEWNEHFPPSLGAVGTPKAIAALLSNQTREISKLKSQLEAEQLHRDHDVTGILRSMDAQLHAYRSSVMHERRQQKLVFDGDIAAMQEQMEGERQAHAQELRQAREAFENKLQQVRTTYEQQISELNATKAQAVQKVTNEMNRMKSKYDFKISGLKDKLIHFRDSYGELRAKYHILARSFNETAQLSDTDDDELMADDGDEDSSSMSSGDDYVVEEEEVWSPDTDDKLLSRERPLMLLTPQSVATRETKRVSTTAPPTAGDEGLTVASEGRATPSRQSSRRDLHRRNSTMTEDTGATGGGAGGKMLKERLLQTTALNRKLEVTLNKTEHLYANARKEIERFHMELTELVTERKSLLQKLEDMEIMNESLRRALGIKLQDGTKQVDMQSLRTIQASSELLCHTPHFLEHADVTAPLRRKNTAASMSAYNNAGIF